MRMNQCLVPPTPTTSYLRGPVNKCIARRPNFHNLYFRAPIDLGDLPCYQFHIAKAGCLSIGYPHSVAIGVLPSIDPAIFAGDGLWASEFGAKEHPERESLPTSAAIRLTRSAPNLCRSKYFSTS